MDYYFILAPNRTDLYWRSKRQGYTIDLADAGIYNQSEADSIVGNKRGDRAIPLASKRNELLDISKQYSIYISNIMDMLYLLGS